MSSDQLWHPWRTGHMETVGGQKKNKVTLCYINMYSDLCLLWIRNIKSKKLCLKRESAEFLTGISTLKISQGEVDRQKEE